MIKILLVCLILTIAGCEAPIPLKDFECTEEQKELVRQDASWCMEIFAGTSFRYQCYNDAIREYCTLPVER